MEFSNEFLRGETLLRGINRLPDFWNDEQNRPSSAAFKDRKGLSVNRTGENGEHYDGSLKYLKDELGERLRAVVEIDVDICNELELYLKYCPVNDNIYHSEIHKSENEPSLPSSVSRKLSKACTIIEIEAG